MPTTDPEVLNIMPSGFIVRWYSSAPIPYGWVLCDGTNNTPNLVKSFALGNNCNDSGLYNLIGQQLPTMQTMIFIMKN